VTTVVIAGTGTGIGKTWVTAELATALKRRGIGVVARKPVQSFDPADDTPTDAEILAEATIEDPHVVCPAHRWLPRAMAPPIAAAVLESAPFHVADLVAEVTSNPPVGAIVLVESVGGVRSPIAIDGDTVTLVSELKPELVVLVADAELGTINLVRLSHDVLLAHRTVVYLNRYDADDEMHARNHDWLVTQLGLEVVADPEALEEVVAALIR
jgi:dethiobiotin synthetase